MSETTSQAQKSEVSFDVNGTDAALIRKIAKRTLAIYEALGAPKRFKNKIAIEMDIAACHANGNPLNLEKLLAADDFNFEHDVFGIRDTIDRETGKLTCFFSPRCSARELVSS